MTTEQRPWRRGRGEQLMVPPAEFRSCYGRPILKQPTWKTPDVPLYLFLGGLAGASSLLAEGAALTGRPDLERVARLAAAGGAAAGTVALVHDLGRPLVRRPAWVVVGGLAICFVEIAVPHVPPVRPIAELLTGADRTTPALARQLAAVAAETAVPATALVVLGHLAARRRA